ncbi:MAG: type II toxin-antitoxin system RelE/ParE family toxin [bacterium]
MKVHWTANALEHLLDIYEYIAHDSPIYAKQMIDQLTRRSEQIASFPLSGRKVPEYDADDIREIIEKPYRIIYRIKPSQIDVLAVIHSAQLLPEDK